MHLKPRCNEVKLTCCQERRGDEDEENEKREISGSWWRNEKEEGEGRRRAGIIFIFIIIFIYTYCSRMGLSQEWGIQSIHHPYNVH